jgi:hypothetical protein
MKYAAEMGSGAMIYVPTLIETDSGIRKLVTGGGTQRQDGDPISLLKTVKGI